MEVAEPESALPESTTSTMSPSRTGVTSSRAAAPAEISEAMISSQRRSPRASQTAAVARRPVATGSLFEVSVAVALIGPPQWWSR